MRSKFAVSMASAVAVVVFVGTSVQAVDAADYVLWRFNAPGARGLGLVKIGTGTLQLEVIGLNPGSTPSLVLSSAGCGTHSTAGNTLQSFALHADANGATYYKVALENTMISSIKAARLMNGSAQLDCSGASRWETHSVSPGGDRPMEALSINFMHNSDFSFAIEVENDETHWVGHDFKPSTEYTVKGSARACPKQPSAVVTLQNTLISSVKGTTYGNEASMVADGPFRSFQIYKNGNRVACGKAVTVVPA